MDMTHPPEDLQRQATEAIIQMFGGLTQFARDLGLSGASTVQGWKERGTIPARQQPRVLEAAKRLNLDLDANDFLRPRPAPEPQEGDKAA